MEEYRYYIAIDENGSPYLEHSLMGTIKGTGQRATKYLMKIGEGAQARYLYTQQEVQAYMNRAQRAAQAQRNKMEREAAHRRAQAQEAKQQVKTTAKNAASTVKSVGQKAVNTVKDKIGVDERQRAIETGNRLNEEYKKSGNKRTAAFDKAANEDAKAVSEYRNTLLGKAETALDTVTKPARKAMSKLDDKVDISVKFRDERGNEISSKEAGKRAGEAAKSGFKSTTERMKDEFRKKKDQAADKVSDVRDSIEQAGRDAVNTVKDKTGISAREKYKDASRSTQRAKDQAEELRERHGSDDLMTKGFEGIAALRQRKQDRAEAEYKETPLGKAENAVKSVKDAAENAVDNAANRNKSKYGEYSKDDPDFSDENSAKAKPVGKSDFYTFNRDDGTSVIIEEDMKWVLPKGVSANDPAVRKALEQFENHAASAKIIGKDNYTNEDWVKAVSDEIDKAIADSRKEAAVNKVKDAGRKAVDAVKDKAGVDERSRVNETRKQVSETKNKLDKAERDLNAADKDVNEVSSKIDKDNGGYKHYDELSRGEKAHLNDTFDRYADKLHARNRADDEALDARIENRKAEAEYDKTPLGKVENVVGTVKDAAKNGAKGLKDTTERMKDEFRKLKDQTVSKAQDTIDALKDKAGVDERARLQIAVREYESAGRSADRMLDDAYKLYNEARRTNNRDKRAELNERASKLQSSAHNLMNEQNQELEKAIQDAENEYNNTPLGKVNKLTKSKTTVNGKRKY